MNGHMPRWSQNNVASTVDLPLLMGTDRRVLIHQLLLSILAARLSRVPTARARGA